MNAFAFSYVSYACAAYIIVTIISSRFKDSIYTRNFYLVRKNNLVVNQLTVALFSSTILYRANRAHDEYNRHSQSRLQKLNKFI